MKCLKNDKGTALIIAILIGMLVLILSMVSIMSVKGSTKRVSDRRKVVSVFNIAEAGKEHALMRIRNDSVTLVPGSGINILNNCPFANGSYTVEYDANPSIDTLWLRSVGSLGVHTARIEVVCIKTIVCDDVEFKVEAAVTARSEITTGGNCNIDGRDWDPDAGTFTVPGKLGLKTCDSFTQKGSSTVGGNGSAPSKPATPGSYETGASSVGYPESPEQVLGLPPGALESYKRTTMPSLPFHNQIVYIDATDMHKHEFNCPDLLGSSGILIVHTASLEGSIKNFNGDFNGLIITDRMNHINAGSDVYGAIITLSPSSGTNAFGNGGSNIRYSSKVLSMVMDSCKVVSDTTFQVISWKQVE